jgi:DNA-binding Lrp family transcriptional regulator
VDNLDRELLNLAQKGLDLCPEPYRALGEKLGIGEDAVLERLRQLKENGIIRRIGGIFNPAGLGYMSCLCGANVDPDRLDAVASFVSAFPGITHNYERSQDYNLWFTLSASSREIFDRIINLIREYPGVRDLRLLPALQVFQNTVTFKL